MTQNQFREAASWHLASELIREQPNWQLTRTIPIEGGGYDCLTLTDPATNTRMLEINRPGSVHLPSLGDDPHDPVLGHDVIWDTLATPGGIARVLDYIRGRLRLTRPPRRPASTPEGLTYRVIAALTAMTTYDQAPISAVSCMSNYGPREDLLAFAPEALQFPPERIWVLLRAGEPAAALAGGWAWTSARERLSLPERRGRGQTISQIAEDVLAGTRPTRRGRIAFVPPAPAIPVPQAPNSADVAAFAETYNGYTRLAGDPHQLHTLVGPLLEQLDRTGRLPAHAGLDLTRAALFYRAREARHGGSMDSGDARAWTPLLERIRELSGGTVVLARDSQGHD